VRCVKIIRKKRQARTDFEIMSKKLEEEAGVFFPFFLFFFSDVVTFRENTKQKKKKTPLFLLQTWPAPARRLL